MLTYTFLHTKHIEPIGGISFHLHLRSVLSFQERLWLMVVTIPQWIEGSVHVVCSLFLGQCRPREHCVNPSLCRRLF